ncbi:uncharacterized protein [Primulina eburnea]|uniref:uncharacterized protein isoform X2 n=1 Tax=Primulina eburnea TaxID=1245227 RepID=UPI003C6C7FC7
MGSSPRRQKTVGNNECLLRSSLICSFAHKPVFPLLAVGKLLLCMNSLGLRRSMSLFMLVRITTIYVGGQSQIINEGLLFLKNKITGIPPSKESPPAVTGGTERQQREKRKFAGPIDN